MIYTRGISSGCLLFGDMLSVYAASSAQIATDEMPVQGISAPFRTPQKNTHHPRANITALGFLIPKPLGRWIIYHIMNQSSKPGCIFLAPCGGRGKKISTLSYAFLTIAP